MGACAGKNKSKKKAQTTNKTEENPIKTEPSSPSSQTPPVSNDSLRETETHPLARPSTTAEDSGIDLDILVIVDEQEEITRRLAQSNAARLVSVTDADLETELAALVYGHPEREYEEDQISVPKYRSSDV